MQNRFLLARKMASQAGNLIMEMAKKSIDTKRKPDKTFVTEADIASDQLIRQTLQKEYPTDNILSEEFGFIDNQSPFTWVIDPIDGTKAYINQVSGFTVMIGLLKNQELQMGVLYEPLTEIVYGAIQGEGAWKWISLNAPPVQVFVSCETEPSSMKMLISPNASKTLKAEITKQTGFLFAKPINGVGSKVISLLEQIGDTYFNTHRISFWDSAAPLIILQEAGGQACMLDGTPFGYDLKDKRFEHPIASYFSNGFRHKHYTKTIQQIYQEWKKQS